MERLQKIKVKLNNINLNHESESVQRGFTEIESFLEQIQLDLEGDLSEKERINHYKLIQVIEEAINKFEQTGSFQPIADSLQMLRIKIKIEIEVEIEKPVEKSIKFFEFKKEKSLRLKSAEKNIRNNIRDIKTLNDLDELIKSIVNMPSDYVSAIEPVFYGHFKDEKNPRIIKQKINILTPFFNTLSRIDTQEITELLKKSKDFTTVSDMVRNILEDVKDGNQYILDSPEKIIEHFFPEKTDFGSIKADPLAIIHEKKLMSEEMPEEVRIIAEKVIDQVNALVTFLSVSLQALVGRSDIESLRKEVEKIGISISTGTKITVLTNRLKNETLVEDYIKTLDEIFKYLDELVKKINHEITPMFAKINPGEWIMEYQRELLEKGDINISELSRVRSIDTIKHMTRKKEILDGFEQDTTLSYLKLKAQEEGSSSSGFNILQNALRFFSELQYDKGWAHEPSPNELPLFNASHGYILEKIKELEREKDELLNNLAKITNKSLAGARLVPIMPGLRNPNHQTAPAVRKFISSLERITKELEEIIILNKQISWLSKTMTTADKRLPALFMDNSEYLKSPLDFLERVIQREKRLIAQYESNAIDEGTFRSGLDAFKSVKKLLRALDILYPKYRSNMIDRYWLSDIFTTE